MILTQGLSSGDLLTQGLGSSEEEFVPPQATTLREALLPTVNDLRGISAELGLRRYRLFIRRRTWTGAKPGLGNFTNVDTEVVPPPRIMHPKLQSTDPHEIAGAAGSFREGDYFVSNITPAFYQDGLQVGGYTPDDLRPRPATASEEIVYVLRGDDGTTECTLIEDFFDRAFRFQLKLRQTRRTP